MMNRCMDTDTRMDVFYKLQPEQHLYIFSSINN